MTVLEKISRAVDVRIMRMKATAKKRTTKKKYEKMPLGNNTAEDILRALNVTPAERRLARAVVDAVTKRRSATK